MTASVDVIGLAGFSRSLQRAVAGDLQKAMVRNLHDSGPKVVADMRDEASTKMERHAAGSVTLARTRDGIDLAGGRGATLGAVLFDGAEYGGRKATRVPYATRSPLGRAYVVRRRTTMQFKPHLGREGYFYWPTIREWLPRITKQQDAALRKALG